MQCLSRLVPSAWCSPPPSRRRPLYPNLPLLLGLWVAQPCDYRVDVQTGDVFGAGTSAKVTCNVFGELGSTGERAGGRAA